MKRKVFLILIAMAIFFTGCSNTTSTSFTAKVEAIEFDYQTTEGPYEFLWSSSQDTYLKDLKEEFELENLVKEATDDYEKVLIVANWVHNLWQHDGNNQPQKGDPLSILREVMEGERFRCVEYAVVINGCLNALGIPSRVLGLKTKDVETRASGAGHVVVEAYLNDLEKWVMVDGQWNVIPTLDGQPLNAVELQKALSNKEAKLGIVTLDKGKKKGFFNWISEYLYYFDTNLDNRYTDRASGKGLMLVPVGANEPKVFQIHYSIGDLYYTNSYKAFYPKL